MEEGSLREKKNIKNICVAQGGISDSLPRAKKPKLPVEKREETKFKGKSVMLLGNFTARRIN